MARTALTVQDVTRSGLEATYTAATADGHAFDNSSGKVVFHVKNGGVGASVVTIPTPYTVDGFAVPDLTVSVPNGGERFIGPFPKSIYNQVSTTPAITQAVLVNVDVTTSVTYAAIKLPY